MSSCSIADRQSPTLLSVSSGVSGDSADLSHKGGSTALKLEGVKRVWGRDGYLAQKEAAEEAAQVEVPSPLRSPGRQGQGDGSHSQTPTPTPTPESEQEKQQLASSLFVGLASQSSVCLMGKSDATSQRFRRKDKGRSTPSSNCEQESDSPASPPSTVDHLLCDSLLDADVNSKSMVSSPEETPPLAAAADPASPEEPDRPKDRRLASHLPAELSGLPHSEITVLCSNQSVDLSACHVQKEDSLEFVVFITNSSDSAIKQTLMRVDSEHLEVNPAVELNTLSIVSEVCDSPVEEVGGHSVAVFQYSLTVKRPEVHVELSGSFSYRCPAGTPQELRLSHRLPLTSFIRPLAVSTEEYGTMWLAFANDTKQNLTLIQRDGEEALAATLNVLKEKLQLHVVEIIGMEGIVACRLLRDQPCLMHCRVHAGALAVWLRSPVPELPDCLMYHCQRFPGWGSF
uniref:AP-4 complex subunit epsilon-1 C-terminal domain-containing protein n=1 Tax=Salarias fasciatus TaxID=181472 RepID=A0A672I0Z6_SALFA